jgi:flavin-dependent dehydrogenase
MTDYDVIVVGAGPAGLMAARKAAEKGAKVLLIEKNKTLGARACGEAISGRTI